VRAQPCLRRGRATGDPIRLSEHPHPGSLSHADVKELGIIPDGGGSRYRTVSQAIGTASPTGDWTGIRNTYRNSKVGTAFVHTVMDEHSCVACADVNDDEAVATAAGVLGRAVAWLAVRGVAVERCAH
jgi:hypothetical protein